MTYCSYPVCVLCAIVTCKQVFKTGFELMNFIHYMCSFAKFKNYFDSLKHLLWAKGISKYVSSQYTQEDENLKIDQ